MSGAVVVADPSNFDPIQTGFFRFRRVGGKYLITNDFGRRHFLSDEEFRQFVSGTLDQTASLYGRLAKDGFIRDHMDFETLTAVWKDRNAFLWRGAGLHAIAVTKPGRAGAVKRMTLKTAEKVVERVFESPSPSLILEIMGGEPLANWEIVRFIVERARKISVEGGKSLRLILVSDLSLMNEAKLKFLLAHSIELRTSLDGPADLHDRNRRVLGGNSHGKTARWLRAIDGKTENKRPVVEVEAAVTRFSLQRHKEIVDEYVELGAGGIFFRNLDSLDLLQPSRRGLACSVDEFLDFYRKSLDYILKINERKNFPERTARTFLTKILTDEALDSMDARFPAGAGLGQLAYDWDGEIYACDEGLLLSRSGDDAFRIGSALRGTYLESASHPSVKALAVASCLDSQPDCSRCAYAPYHGVSPIQNYVEQGDIVGRMPTNTRCLIDKGIMDSLFEKLQDAGNEAIFRRWVRSSGRMEGI